MQLVENAEVVVYLVTGFLESGKTRFLRGTLNQEYFAVDGTTVVILCEEGIEEYDERTLKRTDTVLLKVDRPEDITKDWLEEVNRKYHPERVIFECNGMYPVSRMEAMDVPEGWGLVQKITIVDASTFGVYMLNMKPLFMDMVRGAELVLFNRCTKDMPLASYRRNVKVVNQASEIIFEGEKGEISNIFDEQMPFDLNAPLTEIEDMDYGIWYVDMMDHPDRYIGRKVQYKARVLKPRGFAAKEFVAGRTAMTCCADDTTFIGYICRSPYAPKLKPEQWVNVRGTVVWEFSQAYGRKGPVIKAEYVENTMPLEDEMVYFN